jgi:hypothetical protein
MDHGLRSMIRLSATPPARLVLPLRTIFLERSAHDVAGDAGDRRDRRNE